MTSFEVSNSEAVGTYGAGVNGRAPKTLLCVLERPTQFDVPLWSALSRRKHLRPLVWYFDKNSNLVDPETGQSVAWDNDEDPSYTTEYISYDDLKRRFLSLSVPPDAVITEGWAHRYTWRLGMQCWRRGVPIILPSDRVFNPEEPTARKLARRVLRKVCQPMFGGHISPGKLGLAALKADGIADSRLAKSLYPIDVNMYQRRCADQSALAQTLRERWPAGSKVVIAVAKHAERESPLLIVETFARARLRDPTIKLLFVGDGPLHAQVKARVETLGLGPDVYLPGYVRYALLPGHYAAADVFLHVAQFEPWGISVSEAMACGLPVVATHNIGSSHDLVIEGKSGAIAHNHDPEELAMKLLEVFSFVGSADSKAAIEERVRSVDVECAAAELEALVDRINP